MALFEEAAKRAGPGITRRGLVDVLNNMCGYNDGLGAPICFSPSHHLARTGTGFYRIHNQKFEKATPEKDFFSVTDF
ncbi:MAG: hypothetical protein WDA71_04470 [Actinomycetota bacterium]